MPIHYMQAFKIPVGVIKHIDQMRRQFIWKKNDMCEGINCLINWEMVCALKINCLKIWERALESISEDLWASTLRSLHGITSPSQLEFLRADSSFFLKDLAILP